MTDIITLTVLVVILGGAITYIVKQKKKGVKCIGCPMAGQCPSKKDSCSCRNK